MDLEISVSSPSTSLYSCETYDVNGAVFGKDERRGVDLSVLSSSTSSWIIDENETLYTTTLSSSSSSSSSTTTTTITPTTPTLTKKITYYSNHVKYTTSSMDDSNFHFGQQRGRFWVWPVTHSTDTTNVFAMEDSSMESNA